MAAAVKTTAAAVKTTAAAAATTAAATTARKRAPKRRRRSPLIVLKVHNFPIIILFRTPETFELFILHGFFVLESTADANSHPSTEPAVSLIFACSFLG